MKARNSERAVLRKVKYRKPADTDMAARLRPVNEASSSTSKKFLRPSYSEPEKKNSHQMAGKAMNNHASNRSGKIHDST